MGRKNSKDLIAIAIYQLMYRCPYENITVKLICEKAGVSRMSFYRYYSTKEDIFITFSDERFEEFYDEFMEGKDINIDTFTKNVIAYFKLYSRQIKLLSIADKMSILITQFERYAAYLLNHVKSMANFKYKDNPLAIPYFAGGLYNVLAYWVKNDFKQSEEEMTARLEELLSSKIPLY